MYKPRILVVEDDPASRFLLAMLLADIGHDVVSTANGNEALRYLYSEDACDAVLSDIVMPAMSGIEFSRLARDVRPGLPVILMSGNVGAMALAMESGTLALVKPVSRARLVSVLTDALAN